MKIGTSFSVFLLDQDRNVENQPLESLQTIFVLKSIFSTIKRSHFPKIKSLEKLRQKLGSYCKIFYDRINDFMGWSKLFF